MGTSTIESKFVANTRDLNKGIDQVERKVAGLAAKMDAAGQKMSNAGKTMTMGVTVPILGAGVAAFKFAGELEDSMAFQAEVFGDSANKMDEWSDSAASSFGLSKQEAVEMSNLMGLQFQEIGKKSEAASAKMSQEFTVLAADMASVAGGSVQDAGSALIGAATGEFEQLKKYGVVINDTILKEEAVTRGLIAKKSESLSLDQKQSLVLDILRDKTKKMQGDFARNADGATNVQKTFLATLKETAAEFGTVLLPTGVKILKMINRIATSLSGLSDQNKNLVVAVTGAAAAFGPLLFVGGKLVSTFGKLPGIMEGVSKGLKFLVAHPAILGLAALAAGVYLLYKNSEDFRNIVHSVASSMLAAWGKVVDWWKSTFMPAFNRFKEDFKFFSMAVAKWVDSNIVPALKRFGEWTAKVWSGFVDWLTGPATEAMAPFWDRFGRGVDRLKKEWGQLVDTLDGKDDDGITTVAEKLSKDMQPFWDNFILGTERLETEWGQLIDVLDGKDDDGVESVAEKLSADMQPFWDRFIRGTDRLKKEWGQFVDVLDGDNEDGADTVLERLSVRMQPFWDRFVRGTDRLQEAWPGFVARFKRGATDLGRGIVTLGRGFKLFVDTLWKQLTYLGKIIQTQAQLAWKALKFIWDKLKIWWKVVGEAFKLLGKALWSLVTNIYKVSSAVGQGIKVVMQKVWSVQSKVVRAFFGAGSWLRESGKKIIQGLIDGIKGKVKDVENELRSLTDKLPSWKGPMEVDAKLLTPNGMAIMDSLMAGINAQVPALQANLGGITSKIPTMVGVAQQGANATQSRTDNRPSVVVHVHGSVISERDLEARIRSATDEYTRNNGTPRPTRSYRNATR